MRTSVVIPARADVTEKFAAEELSRYLERITGVECSLRSDAEAGAEGEVRLCIGSPSVNRAAASAWASRPFPKITGEAFAVRSAGPCLIFAGGLSRATLYSVYAFLERYAGARWFYFNPAEQVVPLRGPDFLPKLLEGGVAMDDAPAFAWREIRLQPFFSPTVLRWSADWMAKNRLNVAALAMDLAPDALQETAFRAAMDVLHPELEKRGILAHFYSYNWYKQAPSPEQIATHPEWQAIVGGVPLSPHSETHPPVCLSQPGAVQVFEDNVVHFLTGIHRAYPQTRIFFFMTRYFHNTNWCECPGCTRDIPLAVESEVVNRVARRLGQAIPEALLVWNIGVQDHNTIPMHVNLAPDIALFHERSMDADYTLPFTDPSNDPWWDASLKQLQALRRRLGVHYAFHCEFANLPGFGPQIVPLPYTVFELEYVLRHDVDYLIHHNEGFADGWWVGGLPMYATARAQWRPDFELDELLRDYFESYFGGASAEMRTFFLCWDRAFPIKLFKSQHRNFNDPVASGGHGSQAQIARPAAPDEDPQFYRDAAAYNQEVLAGLAECSRILDHARDVEPGIGARIERAAVMLDYVRREREMTAALLAVQLHRLGAEPCGDPCGETRRALRLFDQNVALLDSKREQGLLWNAEYWTAEQIRSFSDVWLRALDA
jgi:Domain of unknown function (DUF4838)